MSGEKEKIKIVCVFMASGRSRRFGGDKLLHPVDGEPMALRAMRALPDGIAAAVVTRSERVAELARSCGFEPVMNPDVTDDTAITVRLGLDAVGQGADGCIFAVCDQPYLTRGSLMRLADDFRTHPSSICALSWKGVRGNPVIFPSSLFGELRALAPFESGRTVISRHPERVRLTEAANGAELRDVDVPEDLL